MLFFMAAASFLIGAAAPLIRLRLLPVVVGAARAGDRCQARRGRAIGRAVDGGSGEFVKGIKGRDRADPARMVDGILATTLGPLLLGVLLKRRR
jgi:hypothetical protein